MERSKHEKPSCLSPSFLDASPSFCLSTAFSDYDQLIPPHPSQLAALPSLQEYESDGGDGQGVPCIITQDPRASKQVFRTDSRGHVPLNVPVPFENGSFVGEMLNCLRGYPGTAPDEFKGSKLLGRCIIQGMFKTPTAAKDIWVGQELLNKPLLPASFQRLVFTSAAKIFSSTYRVMVEGEGEAVGYLNPLLAIAATVNVSKPGQQPALRAVTEDMTLLDSRLTDRAGRPLAGPQRQRYFDRPSNLEDVVFDTQHVYTFVLCQSIVDMPTFRLKLGALINLDLCPVLNGQPLQLLCKNVRTGEAVLSLLVWHKHLNYPASSKGRVLSDAASSSGSGSIRTYRHSRASSADTSSADVSSLGDATSLCSGSSLSSSLSSSGSSSGTDSPEEALCSECGEDCDADSRSSCCDSEYYSCMGDAEACSSLTEPEEVQQLQQALQPQQMLLQQQVLPQVQAQQQLDMYAPAQQPPLLQPALSAPPNLNYLGGNAQDSSSDVPVRVTVSPQAAAAAAAGHKSNSTAKAKRNSTGGKAAAAVASAAKRLVARLKSCPGFQL